MKKSKPKLKKVYKTKSKFSLPLIIGILILAGALAFFGYTKIVSPLLVAGVMDNYKYNLSQSAAGAVPKNVQDNVAKKIKSENPKLSDAEIAQKANERVKAEAQVTLAHIVANEKKTAEESGDQKALEAAKKAEKAIADAQKLNPQNYTVSDEAKKAAEAKVAADEAQLAASYAQVNAQNTTGGSSCPGANSGIGGGQWAQTGGGVYKTNDNGTSTLIPGSHGCVQCGGGGDGAWGKTVVQCGEGAAANYIVRPDELIDCKAANGDSCKIQNNCWKNGSWYASNTSLGDESCNNGNWGPKVALEKDLDYPAIATALQDKINECEADKVGHYYNGYCYSSEATMNAKIAYDQRVSQGNASGNVVAKDSYISKAACEKANTTGGSCIVSAAGNLTSVIDPKTASSQWKFVPKLTVTTTTNPGTGRTYTVFNFGNSFTSKDVCVAAAGGYANACVLDGKPELGKYKIDNTKLPAKDPNYVPGASLTAIDQAAPTNAEPCKYGYRNMSTECADAPSSSDRNALPGANSPVAASTGKGALIGVGVGAAFCIGGGLLSGLVPLIPACLVSIGATSAVGGTAIGFGVGVANNPTTQTNSTSANTALSSEREALILAYNALKSNEVEIKNIEVDNCGLSTNCLDYKKYIDLSDLKNKMDQNPDIVNYVYQYQQIIAKDSNAFYKSGPAIVGEHHTKAWCEENNKECIKVANGVVYNYLTREQIEDKLSSLDIKPIQFHLPTTE